MTRPARSAYGRYWGLDPRVVYLNHGSFGACPTVVLAEQTRLRLLMESDPMAFFFEQAPRLLDGARLALAQFLNADPDGMTFQVNASASVNTVVRSLEFRPGDEILVLDHAYQACRNAIDFVCARSGAQPRIVALPFPPRSNGDVVEPILAAVSGMTRLALIDTVTSPTGLRLPFEVLTKELQSRGVDVLLDAAHGAGMLPLDLEALGAAYVAGQCHKWLGTPKSSGFLHIRADRRGSITPLVVSHGYSANVPSGERFRLEFDWQGTQDLTPWLCIPKAIGHIGGLLPGGWAAVMERNRQLALRARDVLCGSLAINQRVPDSMIAALVSLPIVRQTDVPFKSVLAGDPLMRTLTERYGIQTVVFEWPAHRARYLRVSAALYNSEAEYEYLASALRELGARAG